MYVLYVLYVHMNFIDNLIFQAMICLAGMGSFLLSLPALQSVTLILTMLIRRLSLSSAKAGQFLGFLQKKLCIYYHPFTRSEGKTLSPRL